ncbi:hypothetical protein KLQUMA228M_12365 [Klebsiella quasipneumoniae subsp. quasipneumoniae]
MAFITNLMMTRVIMSFSVKIIMTLTLNMMKLLNI